MEQRKGERERRRERENEDEKERERKRESESERVRDEGALPVRSVEKGDRGGYRVVAWVCVSTSLAEGREG